MSPRSCRVGRLLDWHRYMGGDASSGATRSDLLGVKGPLDFHALIEDPTPASAYRALKCPALILRGERALKPSRIIAERLAELLPDSRLLVIDGAGHMGPFTHASKVAGLIVSHIATIDAQSWKAKSRDAAGP